MTQQNLQTFYKIKKRSDHMLNQSKHLLLYTVGCWILGCMCIFIFSDNGSSIFWVYLGMFIAVSPICHIAFLGIKLLANLLAIQVLSFQISHNIEDKIDPQEPTEQPEQQQGTFIAGIKLEEY